MNSIKELWITNSHKIDADIPEKYMDEDDFQIAIGEYGSQIIKLIDEMIEKESPYWRLGIAKIAVLTELKQKIKSL